MKRITLILGVVAVMAVMIVALAAPAMAKDNGSNRIDNRVDNQLDRLDNRLDNRLDRVDGDLLVSDVDFSPVFTTNERLADELCSPLSSDALNNTIPGCIFGDRNDDPNIGFVRDIDNNDVDVDFDTVDFDSDVDFVDVARDIDFANGNNHNGNGNGNAHHSGNGHKGNGK